ncbi:thymidylate kinase [Procambarus clarkii]|uniref:thymidylate kinase n=1 Tax=Procambarus clarkii TaxID=6728 RepID=UPI001E67211C|nr:thymidylate kinase-like [Procambarus clarkii]
MTVGGRLTFLLKSFNNSFVYRRLAKMGFTQVPVDAGTNKARGALVVLEGCDRSGKTTQAHMLVKALVDAGKPTVFMCFPDRTTHIGGIINSYLKCDQELDDHAIHLLFSANRWELLPKILSTLQEGTNIIIDRYAYSGVAFSAAKKDMSLEWCKQSDAGLPQPDLVLFLDVCEKEAQTRGQFGEERYEKREFQKRVRDNYLRLKDDSWKVIDANESIEKLQETLKEEVLNAIKKEKNESIQKLWV